MSFQRRQLLQILSYTFGATFILPQNKLAMAAQNPHSQRVLLRLGRQLLNMNREQRKWKK
jgi:hypothetical protein